MRATLNTLAEGVPEWLRSFAPDEWYERYAHRVEEYRLPKEQTKRKYRNHRQDRLSADRFRDHPGDEHRQHTLLEDDHSCGDEGENNAVRPACQRQPVTQEAAYTRACNNGE